MTEKSLNELSKIAWPLQAASQGRPFCVPEHASIYALLDDMLTYGGAETCRHSQACGGRKGARDERAGKDHIDSTRRVPPLASQKKSIFTPTATNKTAKARRNLPTSSRWHNRTPSGANSIVIGTSRPNASQFT